MKRDADAGQVSREVGELTAVERQLLDTARLDYAADDRRRGFDQRTRAQRRRGLPRRRDPKGEIALDDAPISMIVALCSPVAKPSRAAPEHGTTPGGSPQSGRGPRGHFRWCA